MVFEFTTRTKYNYNDRQKLVPDLRKSEGLKLGIQSNSDMLFTEGLFVKRIVIIT